jgi:dimethylhistidine N-methyltransferase
MTHESQGYAASEELEAARTSAFADDVLAGLSAERKTLPCQYFYDEHGSELFERITDAPEYYPTRTETAILRDCAGEIVAGTPTGSVLIEFGSGSSRKTEILLAALDKLAAYVPIDVSSTALDDARARLARRFPGLRVETVVGDFRSTLVLPEDLRDSPRMGFFPGSTIGNFQRDDAVDLLASMATMMGGGGRLIVGVDLRKDTSALLPAYNDAAGITAAFNKNLLVRANRELGADFDLDGFAHEAIFNERQSRIEMHLVSRHAQTVSLLGKRFAFRPGETIHTENSHKYTIADFRDLAAEAGWAPSRVWTDANRLFSVHEIVVR